jgi:DASS family divalent anion:Na+ symporter
VTSPDRKRLIARVVTVALALGLWFSPAPEGLEPVAWHLFALFVAAIASVVIGAFPILTSSVLALAAAVLSGTLSAEDAYSGSRTGPSCSSSSRSWWHARSKCGLGERLGQRPR